MELSVVIVSWNCKAEVLECLDSLVRHAYAGMHEIILVDNASCDGTVAMVRTLFPDVCVIETGANLGFARAANRGLQAARGTYLLFLNPDVVASPDALTSAVYAMRNRPKVGILGVRLLNADGSVQPSCGAFLSLSALVRANVRGMVGECREERRAGGGRLWSGTGTEEVDWLMGAFLLCRRDVLLEVGGFDEDYFLYAEDMDLCYRVRQRGHRVYYFPEVAIVHYGNRSAGQKWGERREGEIVRAELIFVRKHKGVVAAWVFRLLASGLFLWKGVGHWLAARNRGDLQQRESRRYWHMVKVCLGWA